MGSRRCTKSGAYNTMKRKYTKFEIPRELYRYKSSVEQVDSEQQTVTPVVKLSWDDGVFLYLEGAEYPQKGFTSPEALWACNLAKRNLIIFMKLFAKRSFIPTFIIFALSRWKNKVAEVQRFVGLYIEVSHRNISPFILKGNYMSPMAQELEWFIYSFMKNIGLSQFHCERFSEVVATIIDYDNAYRYRVEDIFSETTKTALLANPGKEVARLLSVIKEREEGGIFVKFKLIGMALRVALWSRKVRNAFRAAIEEIDVRRMGLDEADRYWVCMRQDYKFLGKTYEERMALIKDKSKPALIKKKW